MDIQLNPIPGSRPIRWRQMLQHKFGEYPYWDEYRTYVYKGKIVRTGQLFYTEVYFTTD